MIYEYPFTIKESHLDTFGHVNNAAYLQIFEEARWEIITKNGYGLNHVMETQKGPVILDVKLQFLKELKLREKIMIQTSLSEFNGKIAPIEQKMINAKGETACTALFHVGFFDLKLRKLIPPNDDWLKAIGLK